MAWDLDDLEDEAEFAQVSPEESARLNGLVPPSPSGEASDQAPTEFEDCWDPASPRATPIIFLDVDGVLHSVDAAQEDFLGTKQLQHLRRIVDASGARLVLSSSWKNRELHAQEVAAALVGAGIRRPVGGTPNMWQDGRAAEISAWLAQNSSLVEGGRWLAIDDLPLTPDLPEEHVVQADGGLGLTGELADEAIAKLNLAEVACS